MNKSDADFKLLLKIREIRSNAAARMLSDAERLLKDAEQRQAVSSLYRSQAAERVKISKQEHDPARKKHINGRELALGVVAVAQVKAAFDDASRHCEAAVSEVVSARLNYQERLQNFQLKQKSIIRTEATLEAIGRDNE